MRAYPQAGDPQISKVLKKQAKRNKKQYKKAQVSPKKRNQ